MTLHLIQTRGVPIYDQLILEEALLRTDGRNFCLINEGSPPAIVMGISGVSHELIDLQKSTLPIIKRFSGGGTVVVDENTLFVSFIFGKHTHPFPSYPEPILKWSGNLYHSLFPCIALKENDYAIGARKCGGNAQYIKKDRWLHHTTFLWDWDRANMDLLLHPKKTPAYRQERNHHDFLTPLKDHFPSREKWICSLREGLSSHYQIKELSFEEASLVKEREFRQSTCWVQQ